MKSYDSFLSFDFLNENKEFYRKEQYRNMFILTAITSPKMTLRTLNESSLDQYYCVWDSTNRYLVIGTLEKDIRK